MEPSGHLPANGFYFDNLTRTPEFDEDEADAADNTADYMEVSDAQIAYHKKVLEEVKGNNHADPGGTVLLGLGDANNIPGPNLKHPEGIRDISEWYMAPLRIRNMWRKYLTAEQILRLEL